MEDLVLALPARNNQLSTRARLIAADKQPGTTCDHCPGQRGARREGGTSDAGEGKGQLQRRAAPSCPLGQGTAVILQLWDLRVPSNLRYPMTLCHGHSEHFPQAPQAAETICPQSPAHADPGHTQASHTTIRHLKKRRRDLICPRSTLKTPQTCSRAQTFCCSSHLVLCACPLLSWNRALLSRLEAELVEQVRRLSHVSLHTRAWRKHRRTSAKE